ncbi:hypothetical protein [Marinobacter sp.]|uniref:hypothetical protein n=1 Tax=Marinobacter sp. TaxID=50741 RepID=UPI000C511D55|nr:hypothetical protein [Marinobacter sp.]MAO13480.1 hypothetical protein [Marinobacter sp.]
MMIMKNLRLALDVSKNDVQASTQITPERLSLIEEGQIVVPQALSDFYALYLGIDKGLMSTLLIGSDRRVPFFDNFRIFALKLLNGYLRLSLRMAAIDEKSKTVPH